MRKVVLRIDEKQKLMIKKNYSMSRYPFPCELMKPTEITEKILQ